MRGAHGCQAERISHTRRQGVVADPPLGSDWIGKTSRLLVLVGKLSDLETDTEDRYAAGCERDARRGCTQVCMYKDSKRQSARATAR